jgi:serine phosphatase RsbU (regulator of sigma subunit)
MPLLAPAPQPFPALGPLQLAEYSRTADPSLALGGDWYDAIAAPSGAFLIVGDVQGHDFSAAVVMEKLRAEARRAALQAAGPADVLRAVNNVLAAVDDDRIATALVVHIDLRTMAATVASAGHVAPMRISPGCGAGEIDLEPGPPLGIGSEWPECQFQLDDASMLLLYTDGLVEAHGCPIGQGVQLLHEALGDLPAHADVGDAINSALTVIPADSRDDDVAVLVVASRTSAG